MDLSQTHVGEADRHGSSNRSSKLVPGFGIPLRLRRQATTRQLLYDSETEQ